MDAFAECIYLRLLDRPVMFLVKRITIKAFSQTGEGVERIARRMRGNALFYNVGKCGHQKASPSGEAVGLVPTDEV